MQNQAMTAQAADPKWLQFARTLIGTHEVPGAANNPAIIAWASHFGPWVHKFYTADSIPWCGLYAGFVMETAGLKTPGDATLSAANWAIWGQRLAHAVLGAVLVFSRPGGHHVGFYVGEDSEAYWVLGGNQSDSVCIERIAKAHCIAIRWPGEIAPAGSPLVVSTDHPQPLSTNQA